MSKERGDVVWVSDDNSSWEERVFWCDHNGKYYCHDKSGNGRSWRFIKDNPVTTKEVN